MIMKLKNLLFENTDRSSKKKIEEQIPRDEVAARYPLWFVQKEIKLLMNDLNALRDQVSEYRKKPEFSETNPDLDREILERSRKVAMGFMKKVNDAIKQYQDNIKTIYKQN